MENNMNIDILDFGAPEKEHSIIKVIGVGGGGGNAVNHMYREVEYLYSIISSSQYSLKECFDDYERNEAMKLENIKLQAQREANEIAAAQADLTAQQNALLDEQNSIAEKTRRDQNINNVIGQITISHAKAGTTVQVLSLSGVTLCSQNLKEGANIINVSTLQSGTYILKVGDTNIKFIKR